MVLRRSASRFLFAPLSLAALSLAAPLAACDLDGLPGTMHRLNPFARYQPGKGPVIQPDQPAPTALPAEPVAPQRDGNPAGNDRAQKSRLMGSDSDTGASLISASDQALFR